MCRRYTFLHTCGHIGVGPLLHINAPYTDTYNISLAPCVDIEVIELPILFDCPFCSDRVLHEGLEDSLGVLAILAAPRNSPFAAGWRILHVRSADEVDSRDWQDAYGEGRFFNQMAWIPKPCGQVRFLGRAERGTRGRNLGRATEVECAWRQSLGESVRSRLPGMISELNAALISGEGNGE